MNTTYFLNLIAGNLFRTKTNPAIPETYYIGLSKTAPQLNGTGVSEPDTGTGYKRVAISGLSVPDNGVLYNNSAISFDEATGDWGTVTHYVVFDKQSGGELLFYGKLSTSRTIEANSAVTFKPKALEIDVMNTNT